MRTGRPQFAEHLGWAYVRGMADKPAPKADDAYSDEEAAKRRDATICAMIGMKPKPRKQPSRKAPGHQKNAGQRIRAPDSDDAFVISGQKSDKIAISVEISFPKSY